ncbi:MAG: DEAD/DEAH box helicase [Verrucomicrobiales bacterium]
MTNPDRATLDFLNSFSEESRERGEQWHREGRVSQIFGNYLLIRGRVESPGDGTGMETSLMLRGDGWEGESTSPEGRDCPGLYATMLERLERGRNLPESPNEIGDTPLPVLLEEKLGRELSGSEETYLAKLEKRYRRFAVEGEVFDHDLLRLEPRWEVSGYDALELWPVAPGNIAEFWNYIAYALDKRGFEFPPFMAGVTDLEHVRSKLMSWEYEREVARWSECIGSFADGADPNSDRVVGELRLQVTTNEARLQWKGRGEESFLALETPGILNLIEKHDAGRLELDSDSDLLWAFYLNYRGKAGTEDIRLELELAGRFLNELFRRDSLSSRLIDLDDKPFDRNGGELRWCCVPDEPAPTARWRLELLMADGEVVPHALRLLRGAKDLYLSDGTVFPGPPGWGEGSEVLPSYSIPAEVIESATGVEFLIRSGTELAPELADRIDDSMMVITLGASIVHGLSAVESEHLLLKVEAVDAKGTRREILDREGWRVVEDELPQDGRIAHYDRGMLHRIEPMIAEVTSSFDEGHEAFKVRVTRTFPKKFSGWAAALPGEIRLEADELVASLLSDPVKASLRFEVVSEEIDWFDLKVAVEVEGHDLSAEEMRILVAARGDFVRIKSGGWMRVEFDLGEAQQEAVKRLGIDPFDLSGENHRMHALQLNDPAVKEVFDPKAWDRICKRAEAVKLRVRPAIPSNLKAELRPYQVEGFHFLAYLTTNGFGGVLADDMGLGKTVQSLCWILWLRTRCEGTPLPVLVVCPKSVLDVWASEVKKFAPGLRIQILRSKEELNMDALKNNVDLLVLNYAQLRVGEEILTRLEWLAVILDEGQQIKNPDSKAARAARKLQSENRIVLTGTPIENRLLDVWSLMAFAMPGVLGDRKYFRDCFDRRKDVGSQGRLSSRLRPFLLRRTKGQVAMDLPPRIEEEVYCQMEGDQAELYRSELEKAQKTLLGLGSEKELRKNSLVVLQTLMRLRQICCHPGLVDPAQLDAESAKLNALFYLLDQLREEGHKVLVFSQFVKMLNIIRGRLENQDRPYCYLTGQTKDRGKVIEDFQTADEASVFLLSLKAGGSGLNLTAASYVILYDPWWNPAVENQAIDRTHRIGQKNKVIAYRLLIRDTVEEKVRVLQEQKRQMLGDVLGEETFSRNLEMKDIKFLFAPENEPEGREKVIIEG